MVTRIKGSIFTTADNFGYVSLGDVGKGDGVFDNTSVIAATLAAGFAVFIPVGVFLISSFSVPDDAMIFGLGKGSQLKVKNLTNSININVGSRVLLKDFSIEGNKLNQVGSGYHTLQLSGGTGSIVDNLYISNPKGDGINITGANSNTIIRDCYVTGYTENGIRVTQGAELSLINCNVITSDAAATGDGISISSNGSAVTSVQISSPVCRGNTGRGLAIIGNGARNVSNICIDNPRTQSNVGNGIHLINADSIVILGGLSSTNGIDGIRIEGDVQNCRFVSCITKGNTSFGIREVISGSTPNFNGLIYGVCSGNGNNTITKVGASSYIV